MAPKFDRSLVPAAPDFHFEQELWQRGVTLVAGVDEAGRGALAGPVTAGALIFPARPALGMHLIGVRDSKEMSPEARADWAQRLPRLALACGVGFASSEEIDAVGIVPATRLAMQRALQALACPPAHLLVDFLDLPEIPLPQLALIKGDARSLSIAAASILAKTARDAHMLALDSIYPGYGFARHKGYGTAAHLAALRQLGPCPVHRRSFSPVGNSLIGDKNDT